MFENIGGKIKGYAKAVFVIEIFASLVGAIAIAVGIGGFGGFMAFLLSMVIFIIISYLSVMFLYAYGELVENSTKINRNTDELIRKINILTEEKGARPTVAQNPAPINRPILSGPWRCKNCDTQNEDSNRFCKGCGAPRN